MGYPSWKGHNSLKIIKMKKIVKLEKFLETHKLEDLCVKLLRKSDIYGNIVEFRKEIKSIVPTIWQDRSLYRITFVDNDTVLLQSDWLYVASSDVHHKDIM